MRYKRGCGAIAVIVALAVILILPSLVSAAAGGDLQIKDMRGEAGWPQGPEIVGESAFLLEANSGMCLYGKNENESLYPASITKVVTALVVLEHCNLQDEVTFSHNAIYDIEDGGHNWSFTEGEVLTVEQCLYALLLESVNECGYALAEHTSGSLDAFAELMNQKAAELGCTNTHFSNPHGLNDEAHVTTARDMALLFWAALQNEDFYRIDSCTSYQIPAVDGKTQGHELRMHHKMMLSGSEYYYEGVTAGKTGYTMVAKNTLVTFAEREGRQLVCVVMKSDSGGVVYSDTKTLLDYGFDNFQFRDMTAVSRNFCRGLSVGYPLPLTAAGTSAVVLPEGTAALSMDFVRSAEAGAGVVGNLQFSSNGQTLAFTSLRAQHPSALSTAAGGFQILASADTAAEPVAPTDAASSEGETAFEPETAAASETTAESGTAAGSEAALPETTGAGAIEETTAEGNRLVVSDEEVKEGHSFLFWIFIVLLVLIGAVFVYWCVIQLIKRQRRRRRQQRRREAAARKATAARRRR